MSLLSLLFLSLSLSIVFVCLSVCLSFFTSFLSLLSFFLVYILKLKCKSSSRCTGVYRSHLLIFALSFSALMGQLEMASSGSGAFSCSSARLCTAIGLHHRSVGAGWLWPVLTARSGLGNLDPERGNSDRSRGPLLRCRRGQPCARTCCWPGPQQNHSTFFPLCHPSKKAELSGLYLMWLCLKALGV